MKMIISIVDVLPLKCVGSGLTTIFEVIDPYIFDKYVNK